MRVPLLALLLVGSALTAFLPSPAVQAAPADPLHPEKEPMICGALGFSQFPFNQYCIFQGLEILGTECLNVRDFTIREAPEGSDAAPECGGTRLFVSGESENEQDDSREWTRVAVVRFPDWRANLVEEFGTNVTIGWSFLQLYYDTAFYQDNSDQALLQNLNQRSLWATEARISPTLGSPEWNWSRFETSPDSIMNKTAFEGFTWTSDGNPCGGGGTLPNGCGDLLPDCGGDGAGLCRYFVLDWGGFVSRSSGSARYHLDDVVRGHRRHDHGFVIADADYFAYENGIFDAGSGTGPTSNDGGACRDPTHPEPTEPPLPPAQPVDNAESTCLHVFRSSSWPGGGDLGRRSECADKFIKGRTYENNGTHIPGTGVPGLAQVQDWVCWPRLVAFFNRNPPEVARGQVVYNQTRSSLSGGTPVPMGGKAPVNITLDIEDDWGQILDVSYRIETSRLNEAGIAESVVVQPDTKMAQRRWNGSIPQGLALSRCKCENWTYFAKGPLDLPSGSYWINFTIEDTDHNRIVWPPQFPGRLANLVVDETVPTVEDVALRAAEFDHKDVLGFTAEIRSPRIDQRIETVWGEVYQPSAAGVRGTFVKRIAAQPVAGEVDSFRNGLWTMATSWGRFDPLEGPGPYELWIRANDTLGRENLVLGGAFRVRDTLNPEIQSLAILAPQTSGPEVYLQEVGGPLRVELRARDPENLVAPTGSVTLTSSGKPPVTHDLVLGSAEQYAVSFPAPEAGTWSGIVTVRDAEGRTAERAFTLVSLAPSEPVFRSPKPAQWANLTPDISIEVFDLTADPAGIRLFVGDPIAGVTERTAAVEGTAPLLTVRPSGTLGTLRHNRTIQIRVEATDALGLTSSRTWEFTVDAVPPTRTELAIGDPKDVRGARTFVTAATPLVFAGGDAESGLAGIRWRATDLTRNLTTPWAPYTQPFSLGAAAVYRAPGRYRIEWQATDQAGNVEALRSRDLEVDTSAPTLTIRFDGLSFDAVATDAGSGLASVTVWYRPAAQTTWNVLEIPIRDPSRVDEHVTIPPITRGERAYYYAVALDRIGNAVGVESREKPVDAISPNHPPTLGVELPGDGSVLKGIQTIPYSAPDPDGDSVRLVMSVRPLVFSEARTLATVAATGAGTLAWNTSEWPDGAYEIVVLASDGTDSIVAKSRIEVRNTASGAFAPSAPTGRVEFADPVTFTATLYKPVREARVRVVDSAGSEAGTVVLRDDGKEGDATAGDHVFTAQYTAPRKGTFKPTLEIQYENEPAQTQELPQFTVESTLTRALARNAVPIVLGILVATSVAAAVVVQLVRYGYLFARD